MAALTERRRRAIGALLTTPSVVAAAKTCGVGERTLRRWLTDPEFRRAYAEASRGLLNDSIGRLRAITGDAVTALSEALRGDHASVRVRAALGILDLAVKVDVDELATRIEALEAAQAAAQHGGG